MALAILSLDHRMDPRLRGWCQIDVVQGIMPDGSHYSMTAITFPSFTAASLSRQCVCAWEKVCVCVSHSYVTLNLSPSNQQLSTRQALLLTFPYCGNCLASVPGLSACMREDAVQNRVPRLWKVRRLSLKCPWLRSEIELSLMNMSGVRGKGDRRWEGVPLWSLKNLESRCLAPQGGSSPEDDRVNLGATFKTVRQYFSPVTPFKLHFAFRPAGWLTLTVRLQKRAWKMHWLQLVGSRAYEFLFFFSAAQIRCINDFVLKYEIPNWHVVVLIFIFCKNS